MSNVFAYSEPELMKQLNIPPNVDPIVYLSKRRGLDLDLMRKMTEAHREVCRDAMIKGACRVETPEEIAIRELGDPEEFGETHNIVINAYLSASLDAAAALGWFVPHYRRGNS